MAIVTFHPSKGWSLPEIKPYSLISLDPAASCLQYSSTCFEGMKVKVENVTSNTPQRFLHKAYLGADGKYVYIAQT